MNTNMQNEQNRQSQISALVDGEQADHELSAILATLRTQEHKDDWDIYHKIGDILNSEELSVSISDGFSARMAASLAAEPIYLGLKPLTPKTKTFSQVSTKVAYAMAAMFAFALILVPRFAGQEGAETSAPYYAGQFAAVNSSSMNGAEAKKELAALSASHTTSYESKSHMLRDPQIDSYLAAHQRYSNSTYSAVEYETSPTNQEAGK
ncbi:sigma-E factor negative regulatory protein [Solimicrobium silvestre]|uniref:Negative regulator of sigma E activity n=1 Tax=Solimicrobium silvestre TaxID=2099400 RepID=A0A2S9GWX2_9BURK|nr:RseA family anti-sigma factor [Solimicrobium silvestre]PRC92219.1 Negative regulator of sigma E activity [Solimicrobium silvestre]